MIVSPEQIKITTEEKLNDTSRYKNVGIENPLPKIKQKVNGLWIQGYKKGYVNKIELKKTMGINIKEGVGGEEKFTHSTADKFKAGIPYGYPLYKIHKLSPAQIESKMIPPSRFVTDLSNGVTSRSGKFMVSKWLSDLCKDFATDLVRDTTQALKSLEEVQSKGIVANDNMCSFSLDVVALYDSLKIDLVMKALTHAIKRLRPLWSKAFVDWLLALVMLSLRSAYIKYGDHWFESENGVPTGGKTSVDIANIAVFFVFNCLIYDPCVKPKELVHFIRFVDDGSGIWKGTKDSFLAWFHKIRKVSFGEYNLDLTFELTNITEYSQFLDIRFKFEGGGVLSTDLYKKTTDGNRYLHFTSYHPRHVFRSIISSQALRYRRVINNDKILNCRLEELKEAFRNSAYPDELIDELVDPVKKYKRSLEYKSSSEKEKSFKVPWVTTFGAGYEEAKQKSKKINQTLSLSSTWKNEQGPIIMPVCRRAPNLKDTLFQRKALALKPQTASPVPCSAYRMNKRGRKCQCCSMLSDSVEVHSNNIVVQSAGGGCKSSNIIYCVKCLLCSNFNCYVGKTVTTLHKRLNEHRASFSSLIKKNAKMEGRGHCKILLTWI